MVKLNAAWPDYVFKPKYVLPTLIEVKTYIDKNQHLPDMPSEAEVTKNGINLGEIVKIQTKKIEELTLYLIDKDKQLTDQQKQIEQLKQEQKNNQLPQNELHKLKLQLVALSKRIYKN
jgi:predicted phage tail protein